VSAPSCGGLADAKDYMGKVLRYRFSLGVRLGTGLRLSTSSMGGTSLLVMMLYVLLFIFVVEDLVEHHANYVYTFAIPS
jgi:hypothetical protein